MIKIIKESFDLENEKKYKVKFAKKLKDCNFAKTKAL